MHLEFITDVSLSRLWGIVKDKEDWHAVAHGVTKSWAGLSDRITRRDDLENSDLFLKS